VKQSSVASTTRAVKKKAPRERGSSWFGGNVDRENCVVVTIDQKDPSRAVAAAL